jgi:uncharacterized oligopeptide transporter (OPT) family protein
MAQEKQADSLNVNEFLKEQCAVPHPKTLREPGTMIIILITGVLGAIIGMELMVNVGISANTSIIGALIAVMVGFIPIKALRGFQNIHRQNIVETSISAATFTAGNVFMLSLGTIWVFGNNALMLPMIIGCVLGVCVDISVMYWLFDTPAFPANGTWPVGVATAETIISASQGGKRALLLVASAVVGAVGQFLKIPMDIFGVCWIGNIWALLMFGIGLLFAGYSKQLIGIRLSDMYIPHGIMIGAGIVALIQLGILLFKKTKAEKEEDTKIKDAYVPTKDAKATGIALQRGTVLFLAGAIIMAVVAGLWTEMGIPQFILWILFTGLTSVIAELLIGTAAMHSGWFPAMATSLIFLILGMLLKFPPAALALLVGYKVCTGPAFADMGYDLKTGWLLRLKGTNVAYELEGRKQQFHAEFIGVIIGIVVALFSFRYYFTQNLIPPAAKVFDATIKAGTSPEILKYLLIFSLVGAAVQAIGGTKRQIGVLFATGLLIGSPFGGIAALVSITIRFILQKVFGKKIETTLSIAAAGFIAGSSVFSFVNGTIGTIRKKIG